MRDDVVLDEQIEQLMHPFVPDAADCIDPDRGWVPRRRSPLKWRRPGGLVSRLSIRPRGGCARQPRIGRQTSSRCLRQHRHQHLQPVLVERGPPCAPMASRQRVLPPLCPQVRWLPQSRCQQEGDHRCRPQADRHHFKTCWPPAGLLGSRRRLSPPAWIPTKNDVASSPNSKPKDLGSPEPAA